MAGRKSGPSGGTRGATARASNNLNAILVQEFMIPNRMTTSMQDVVIEKVVELVHKGDPQHLCIEAVAGAGKTSTILRTQARPGRALWILDGVRPPGIPLSHSVAGLQTAEGGRPLSVCPPTGTWHRNCATVWRPNIPRLHGTEANPPSPCAQGGG